MSKLRCSCRMHQCTDEGRIKLWCQIWLIYGYTWTTNSVDCGYLLNRVWAVDYVCGHWESYELSSKLYPNFFFEISHYTGCRSDNAKRHKTCKSNYVATYHTAVSSVDVSYISAGSEIKQVRKVSFELGRGFHTWEPFRCQKWLEERTKYWV